MRFVVVLFGLFEVFCLIDLFSDWIVFRHLDYRWISPRRCLILSVDLTLDVIAVGPTLKRIIMI